MPLKNCTDCKRWVEGMTRVVKKLKDRGAFIHNRLHNFLASSGHSDAAQMVFGKIAAFSDDEGILGLKAMVEILESNPNYAAGIGDKVRALFADTTMFDRESINDFLKLLKKVVDGTGATGANDHRGLGVLLNSLNGQPGARGTWYVMKYAEKAGLNKVARFEVAQGVQELDLVLDLPKGMARFFECKAGISLDPMQGVEHIIKLAKDEGWRDLRIVVNTADKDELLNQGRRLLAQMLENQRLGLDTSTEKALLESLKQVRSKAGIATSEAQMLAWNDLVAPLSADQTKAVQAVTDMFVEGFKTGIPVQ